MARSGYLGSSGLALATSANGAVRSGTALPTGDKDAITAYCHSEITTSSVVATFKLQVSQDNSAWVDVKLPNNAAVVDTAAGTGSAVLTELCLPLNRDVFAPWKFFRVTAKLSGASTNSADQTSVTYYSTKRGSL